MLLQTPGAIGPLRLKNRVLMAPMGTNFGTTDGFSSDRDTRYYAERARGGVALVTTEAMNVSPQARNHRRSLCAFHDRYIPGLAAIASAIHEHDALAVAQLNHRGRLLRRSVLDMRPVGPSRGAHPATGEPVAALCVDEIHHITRDFVGCARRLSRAGFDGVELHAGNGYLFQQFLSPRVNHRDDAYGGSLENRMRLLIETVTAIRDALPALPLLVRISASEYAEGGYPEADAVQLACALERAGVAAISVSAGSNETPALSRFAIQPPSFPRRYLELHAARIKAAVGIPVIAAGRIVTPEDAEAVLAAGSADFIALGRALLSDPHWCAKAFGRLATPIRECIACNVCLERLSQERDVACVQNPLVGTEFESLERLEPAAGAGPRLRVLILGAGVSGAEAARVAARAGHAVELWDAASRPGGQMPLAVAGPYKSDVEAVWRYRAVELDRLGVPIRLHASITVDDIRRLAPDVVFVATGSLPRTPPWTAGVRVPVHQAWDVLFDPDRIAAGTAVTIVGGGMVGAETADLLVGRGVRVTVVEMGSTVAPEMARSNRFDLLARLERGGAMLLTDSSVTGVSDGKLILVHGGSDTCVDPGDGVVLAIGPEPNRDVVPLVEAAGVPYVLIGDCNRPGDFLSGIQDASMAALALEHWRS
jgi:2,4-dienoyl-CoA reductase-like NADH-dependent reductase (Old Yellow Enzyme family)/NADPH-dependent 2,4-dienoyl-CoA reductase/sulfur reductase-like enzyme